MVTFGVLFCFSKISIKLLVNSSVGYCSFKNSSSKFLFRYLEAPSPQIEYFGTTISPIFIDIYGESFLWNMVRKMMRVFVDVAIGKMTLDEVQNLLNPLPDAPRANIKVMEAEYLILMDIQYDGIKFRYDDYACERFKRDLVDSLSDLQKRYAIRESIVKSLNDVYI